MVAYLETKIKKLKLDCPYLIEKFPYHNELKQSILNAINTQQEYNRVLTYDKQTDISKSDWNTSKTDSSRLWLSIFKPGLDEYLTNAVETLGYKSFNINEIWFQQYEPSAKHGWHVHSGNWTNVYFLEFPVGSPKTQMKNPLSNVITEFDVSEGDILTFPSFIVHRAPINFTPYRKTIISWNMYTDLDEPSYQ
jgi:uncharacterized RmlC-like cupin family protein